MSEPNASTPELKDLGRFHLILGVVCGILAILSLLGCIFRPERFFTSYLVGVLFVISIGTGALFWVMIHFLTKASWSTNIRRSFEHLGFLLLPISVLALPILFGIPYLYSWSDTTDAGELLTEKIPYLNIPFFVVRSLIYLIIWAGLAWIVRRQSLLQDESGDPTITRRLTQWSGAGLLLLALTTTFASFDWIMSLDYHWYSNLLGVYFWSGSILASLAAGTAVVIALYWRGYLRNYLTEDVLDDLGKMLFGFTFFWGYIAFSQYFLIWYANIPEETEWYITRVNGSWSIVSLLLLLGHFVVPFGLLLLRRVKRSPVALFAMSIWLLLFHWVDLFWQVVPTKYPTGFTFNWLDGTHLLLFLCIPTWFFVYAAGKHSLVPLKDPKLQDSVAAHA